MMYTMTPCRLFAASMGTLLLLLAAPTFAFLALPPVTTSRTATTWHDWMRMVHHHQSPRVTPLFALPQNVTDTAVTTTTTARDGGGYVRIEEWNEQRKTNLQWDEKVQFDGQAHGNRWQQHEILRQNLFK